MNRNASPSAAALIIGNEILTGKTQDVNLKFLGSELGKLGIALQECRVVRDDVDAIVLHLNECRRQFDYVFTTGGIGPTHDDVTAEAVAKAFGVQLVLDPEAVARLKHGGKDVNEARMKMARLPDGAVLIDNPISAAPGFRVDNVFVLAGIPAIAHAMFASAAEQLRHGAELHSASLDVFLREGDFAEALAEIAAAHEEVEIGSYPFARDGRYGANLVVRGSDARAVEAVLSEISERMEALGGDPRMR